MPEFEEQQSFVPSVITNYVHSVQKEYDNSHKYGYADISLGRLNDSILYVINGRPWAIGDWTPYGRLVVGSRDSIMFSGLQGNYVLFNSVFEQKSFPE